METMAWGAQAGRFRSCTISVLPCSLARSSGVLPRRGKQTPPPRSVLSGEAWHKVRSNLLTAAPLDSQPVLPLIWDIWKVEERNQIEVVRSTKLELTHHINWSNLVSDNMNIPFVKIYSFMLPKAGLPSGYMQLRPFHFKFWRPGRVRDILSKLSNS